MFLTLLTIKLALISKDAARPHEWTVCQSVTGDTKPVAAAGGATFKLMPLVIAQQLPHGVSIP
jgi:hypothetical protein